MTKQQLRHMCKMAKTYQHPNAPRDNMKHWAEDIKKSVAMGLSDLHSYRGVKIESFIQTITSILKEHSGLPDDYDIDPELIAKVGKALGWTKQS